MTKLSDWPAKFDTTSMWSRIVSAVFALVAFWLFIFGQQEIAFFGFPDSHVTDFQKAIKGPLNILLWTECAFGLYFLCLALAGNKLKPRGLQFIAVVIAFIAVVIVATLVLPWFFGVYLQLDNGIGG